MLCLIVQVYATARQFAAINNPPINYFFVMFNLGADAVRQLRRLEPTLASAVNMDGPVSIVTHDSFPNHEALKKIVSKYRYVSILTVPDTEVSNKRNWVLWLERLKLSFLMRNLGNNVVYLELDQIFAPGTGQAFTKVFADYDFDLALTYKNKADTYGCTNTGVMLFRASEVSLYFLKQVIDATVAITNRRGGRIAGGENQLGIDAVVKKCIPQGGQNRVALKGNRSILLHALNYPGPLNYNAVGCCGLPDDTLVAHVKSWKKQFAFQACCRDFAGDKSNKTWLYSCNCKPTSGRVKSVKCTAQDTQDATAVEWCEA